MQNTIQLHQMWWYQVTQMSHDVCPATEFGIALGSRQMPKPGWECGLAREWGRRQELDKQPTEVDNSESDSLSSEINISAISK
jgi:hypothetical protein